MPKLPKKLRQSEHIAVHCAVCLQQGKMVTAFTVVNSYASCEAHIQLVSKPGFDISSLQSERGVT